ncbi:MAG: aminomethyltransferase family protein [Deltaproteobacteria bacterium]|nr:aminomethyltransferase family protein [Deltaproteobacteria bacterium]
MPFDSPFHERMVALNETWKYKEWAGITAPCRYIENHVYEYTAFRQSAGLIDVTPLYKYELRGKDAAAFLSRITTKDVTKLKPGRVTYLCWCDDEGKVVDDGTVSRLGEDWVRMTAAEPQYAWLTSLARGFDVEITDISRTMAALAVQGPTSREVLKGCVDGAVDTLKFFGTIAGRVAGREVRVSRTGYTGDLGYEVWCKNEDALAVWDAVVAAGKAHALVPAGLDALDMTRIEAGFVLLGVDYFSAPHVTVAKKKSSPYEIGLDWTVELEREPFVGQAALLQEKKNGGPRRALVGLELDWLHLESLYQVHELAPQLPAGASRESLPIYAGGRQVGRVSSSTWSPTLKKYLALGTVEVDYAKEGTVLEVEHTVLFERRLVRAKIVKRPFFDPERKRKP